MKLSQFYTESHIGDRLINSLQIKDPKQAFDLGFGSGSLLKSAKKRWNDIKLVGVDVDPRNIEIAKQESIIETSELNGFSENLPKIVTDKFGAIDVLISNPPFYQKKIDNECLNILEVAGLSECISNKSKTIPAELVFLAQNLRLLSDNGEIGIILPAGLISGERWKKLRRILFEKYTVHNIIQITSKSFKKTEASTFILTISKDKGNANSLISISHLDKKQVFKLPFEKAVERADYDYHEYINERLQSIDKISSDDFLIFRGNLTNKYLKNINCSFIHSTDIEPVPKKVKVKNCTINGAINCIPGDILIARVGSRCVGRSVYIRNGSIPVSDCIIVVRAKNKKVREQIWMLLNSNQSRNYFKNSCLGVGAKYLTHSILQNFLTNKVN